MVFPAQLAGGVEGMSRPLVSILIPCHDGGKYVGAAVQSALDQTWPELEVIVVNDSSTDDSAAVLEKFAGRGVKVFSEKFGNAAAARNHAWRHSRGDYVKFFDADDLLAPGTVAAQVERLAGSQTAAASAEWGRFYGDDLGSFQLSPQSVWRDMNGLDWLAEAWMDARPMTQPGIFLLPRALAEKAGGWNEKLSLIDDFEYFARVLSLASEVRFTPGARLCYRSNLSGSLSGRKTRAAVESAFQAVTLGTNYLLTKRQDEKDRRACANLMQDFIYTYYPSHGDLLRQMEARIKELGGSNLPPGGPPRFEQLRRFIGWKLARRAQRMLRGGE